MSKTRGESNFSVCYIVFLLPFHAQGHSRLGIYQLKGTATRIPRGTAFGSRLTSRNGPRGSLACTYLTDQLPPIRRSFRCFPFPRVSCPSTFAFELFFEISNYSKDSWDVLAMRVVIVCEHENYNSPFLRKRSIRRENGSRFTEESGRRVSAPLLRTWVSSFPK